MAEPKTLYDKIWEKHLVEEKDDGTCILYIDRQIIHEITSAQAFDGLRENNRPVRVPDAHLLVADHNVPTAGRADGIETVSYTHLTLPTILLV